MLHLEPCVVISKGYEKFLNNFSINKSFMRYVYGYSSLFK